jgi:hypothetical protein
MAEGTDSPRSWSHGSTIIREKGPAMTVLVTPASGSVPSATVVDDDATRHLSAAAQVNERFADEIIEEFLAQPRRATPPSPGVDPVVVLAEALAARRRRVVRDIVLLALFIAFAVLVPLVALAWVLWVALGVLTRTVTRFYLRRRGQIRLTAGAWLAEALFTLPYLLISGLRQQGADEATGYGEVTGSDTIAMVFAVVCVVVMLSIVLFDKAFAHSLLRGRFGPSWHRERTLAVPWPPPPSTWYGARLQRIAASHHQNRANILVHGDYRAFVGSGELTHAWSMALPLRPTGEQAEVTQLTPGMLHAAVSKEVLALRDSVALAPGQRLRGLRETREAITSADSLLMYANTQIGAELLPDPAAPPVDSLGPERIGDLTDQPAEWIRCYQAFRVESWHRELVVSAYLHVGCQDDMLYLEWNACQLNPVGPEFRVEQMKLNKVSGALWAGLAGFAMFPASLLARLRLLWRAARDLARGGKAYGYGQPEDYGARRSIREIAADIDTSTYFQSLDGVRYLKLLERRALAAIDHVLREHGLSAEEFARQSDTIIQSTVVNGGTFTGVNIIGQGNRVRTGEGKTDD